MTETGIYGGSFNPIHRGHVELAERLCRDEGLDELWFMVSPQNPFKKSSPDLLDENSRLELARMAVREHPCLKVSDFEFRLPRPSYTADTLAALRQAYPDRLFTLVISSMRSIFITLSCQTVKKIIAYRLATYVISRLIADF
jgi:nicotinate-nucleotide adenylyltransferase